ncbi:DUF4956 domain-containing protein [Taibaiella sp. KBW10]|uniref:DUF4956 domain-containing protein n=1 Tax=Taibaiella sp. KBW10 TaxID=2153357 RepID=UPI000F59C8A7|nr:DUF4956 domain-containing protein [Taibaiella sp. KBW10]
MGVQEIVERFLLLIVSIGIIYYFTNRNRIVKLHPLVNLLSICTFFLCLVFTKVDVSIGIGFGLFAIFSILRFRTESFSIQTTIFIFVSITLSMLDILLPLDRIEFLAGINLVIILAFVLLNYFEKKDVSFNDKKSVDIITATEDFLKLNEAEKKNFIQEKTQFSSFSYQIRTIDLRENKVVIKVSY